MKCEVECKCYFREASVTRYSRLSPMPNPGQYQMEGFQAALVDLGHEQQVNMIAPMERSN